MSKSNLSKSIIKDIHATEKILKENKLLYDVKGFSADKCIVKSLNNPYFDKKNTNNFIYWEKNNENYTFKLIDNSIIYFKFEIESDDIVKANINYVSGTFLENNYNEISLSISDEKIETVEEYDRNDYEDFLITEYLRKFKVSELIIENILKLNRNIITVRLDIDVKCTSKNHPESHLTINNIKNSRFKVNKKYLLSDFVYFILDIIYGVKFIDREGVIILKD